MCRCHNPAKKALSLFILLREVPNTNLCQAEAGGRGGIEDGANMQAIQCRDTFPSTAYTHNHSELLLLLSDSLFPLLSGATSGAAGPVLEEEAPRPDAGALSRASAFRF